MTSHRRAQVRQSRTLPSISNAFAVGTRTRQTIPARRRLRRELGHLEFLWVRGLLQPTSTTRLAVNSCRKPPPNARKETTRNCDPPRRRPAGAGRKHPGCGGVGGAGTPQHRCRQRDQHQADPKSRQPALAAAGSGKSWPGRHGSGREHLPAHTGGQPASYEHRREVARPRDRCCSKPVSRTGAAPRHVQVRADQADCRPSRSWRAREEPIGADRPATVQIGVICVRARACRYG